jgi:hypothetical protein
MIMARENTPMHSCLANSWQKHPDGKRHAQLAASMDPMRARVVVGVETLGEHDYIAALREGPTTTPAPGPHHRQGIYLQGISSISTSRITRTKQLASRSHTRQLPATAAGLTDEALIDTRLQLV